MEWCTNEDHYLHNHHLHWIGSFQVFVTIHQQDIVIANTYVTNRLKRVILKKVLHWINWKRRQNNYENERVLVLSKLLKNDYFSPIEWKIDMQRQWHEDENEDQNKKKFHFEILISNSVSDINLLFLDSRRYQKISQAHTHTHTEWWFSQWKKCAISRDSS